jgi:hypothetical protein
MRTTTRILLLVTILATGAHARAEVKVADDVSGWGFRFSSLEYGVSERLGRAWLVLRFTDDGLCRYSDAPCPPDMLVRATVPGLTYAPSTKEVVYRDGSEEPLVCAQAVRHSFIVSWETVEATGQCGYHVVGVDRFVDDGFEGRTDKHKEIWFGAASSQRGTK